MASHVIGPFLVASEPLDDYERDALDAAVSWSFLTLLTDGSFSGSLTLQPMQTAILIVTGDTTMARRLYESNTAEISLVSLRHSAYGDLSGTPAVTYEVFRAAGTSHASGSMTWSGTARQWQATFTAPDIDATATERLCVVVRSVAQGATTDFVGYVTVYGILAA